MPHLPRLTRELCHLLQTQRVATLGTTQDDGSPFVSEWELCKAAYLFRFPGVEHMTELGDFRFVAIDVVGARHISGFGAARTVGEDELKAVLGGKPIVLLPQEG